MSVSLIKYKDKTIMCVDYRGKNTEDSLALLEKEASVIREADTPLLVLDDMRDFTVSRDFTTRGVELGKELRPQIHKMAQVVKVTGLKRIIVNSFMNFSGIQMKLFDEDEMDKAKEYLVA